MRFAQHRRNEALALGEQATNDLQTDQKEGPDSASTQLCHFIWAMLLSNDGNLLQAYEKHKEVLDAFGESGNLTLHSYFAVSHIEYKLGRYHDARSVLDIKCLGW